MVLNGFRLYPWFGPGEQQGFKDSVGVLDGFVVFLGDPLFPSPRANVRGESQSQLTNIPNSRTQSWHRQYQCKKPATSVQVLDRKIEPQLAQQNQFPTTGWYRHDRMT